MLYPLAEVENQLPPQLLFLRHRLQQNYCLRQPLRIRVRQNPIVRLLARSVLRRLAHHQQSLQDALEPLEPNAARFYINANATLNEEAEHRRCKPAEVRVENQVFLLAQAFEDMVDYAFLQLT